MDSVRFKELLGKHLTDHISSVELEELLSMMQEIDTHVQEEILDELLSKIEAQDRLETDRKNFLYSQIQKATV